ncbi:MAG: efflux RND transporter permease subunit [Burkholderiales bacterium]|nr:efflux RND transporter permease subunit [Burkholderiales bacterium]
MKDVFTEIIERPVATSLLTLGITLLGLVGFSLLPITRLPEVEIPTIFVSASMPGASPETMASTVATPLERALGNIAGITEMTSTSSLGSTRIVIQFDLSRNIDSAAREVQAAINAASSLLPSGMPRNPTYRKANPANAPVIILSLTSETMTRGQMYDVAATVLAQRLSQVEGVGDVTVSGSSLPAVRVELNPTQLSQYGVSMDIVRRAIASSNANRPKGMIEYDDTQWLVGANDQAFKAEEYKRLIISYRDGAPIRLEDIADVIDSVQDVRNAGMTNGKPSVLIQVRTQAGANIIETVDRVHALLPTLRASMPAAMDMQVTMDRTPSIRASLREVERALLIAIALVILMVFIFLRNIRATLIPSVTVPVSLISTFIVMYLCGFTLNNLSLMALTVATGFVVDDAIVVLENISRHRDMGKSMFIAAHDGVQEVSFTVVSMTLALIAVFVPILFMTGLVGRFFHEFSVTLTTAIMVSMVVALTTIPMMYSHTIKPKDQEKHGKLYRFGERFSEAIYRGYGRSLAWLIAYKPLVLFSFIGIITLNVFLYIDIPKSFLPMQDTGRIIVGIRGDQSISFQAMKTKYEKLLKIVMNDPAVDVVTGFTGGRQSNRGSMFIALKPLSERKESAQQIALRLQRKLAPEPGIRVFMRPAQDLRIGGRESDAEFLYTLQADDISELREWAPRIRRVLAELPQITDVNTDDEDKSLQTMLTIDRDAVAKLGLTVAEVDSALNNAFGQRQVSTIYNQLNQYRVVMESAPEFTQSPDNLKNFYLVRSDGAKIPLSEVATFASDNAALSVNHQGQFITTTISFNLAPGYRLSQAMEAVTYAVLEEGLPVSIFGSFQGTARAFLDAMKDQLFLIVAALFAVYIVLGILYESLSYPLIIISALPSAGLGALLALIISGEGFSLIALLGILLLIGLVMKNAILIVDFALTAQRRHNLPPEQAIYRAALLRLRPILMTSMTALFAAIPLAIGSGDGAELRRPLGIAIAGGLLLSQLLTLYTIPIIYLYVDRLRQLYVRDDVPAQEAPVLSLTK